METKRTTWEGLKIGQKLKIVSNTNSHNYPLNVRLTLNKSGCSFQSMSNCIEEVKCGNNLYFRDVVLLPITVEDMKEDIRNRQTKTSEIVTKLVRESEEYVEVLQRKIELCESMGLTEYNEHILKVYEILTIAQTKGMTIANKAIKISKLL